MRLMVRWRYSGAPAFVSHTPTNSSIFTSSPTSQTLQWTLWLFTVQRKPALALEHWLKLQLHSLFTVGLMFRCLTPSLWTTLLLLSPSKLHLTVQLLLPLVHWAPIYKTSILKATTSSKNCFRFGVLGWQFQNLPGTRTISRPHEADTSTVKPAAYISGTNCWDQHSKQHLSECVSVCFIWHFSSPTCRDCSHSQGNHTESLSGPEWDSFSVWEFHAVYIPCIYYLHIKIM